MILVDIDRTISPPQPDEAFDAIPHESARAWGFDVKIPTYILNFLKSRDDIVMLATWGIRAATVPEAFGFQADVIDMDEYSNKTGIQGKFAVVKAVKPIAWLDDHITATMTKWCTAEGIITVKPTSGFMTVRQITSLEKKLKNRINE